VENRTLDFHVHEDSDELFYVTEENFHLKTNDGLTQVSSGEMIIIPKGDITAPSPAHSSRKTTVIEL